MRLVKLVIVFLNYVFLRISEFNAMVIFTCMKSTLKIIICQSLIFNHITQVKTCSCGLKLQIKSWNRMHRQKMLVICQLCMCYIYDTAKGYISWVVRFIGMGGFPNPRPSTFPLFDRLIYLVARTLWSSFNNFRLYLFANINIYYNMDRSERLVVIWNSKN